MPRVYVVDVEIQKSDITAIAAVSEKGPYTGYECDIDTNGKDDERKGQMAIKLFSDESEKTDRGSEWSESGDGSYESLSTQPFPSLRGGGSLEGASEEDFSSASCQSSNAASSLHVLGSSPMSTPNMPLHTTSSLCTALNNSFSRTPSSMSSPMSSKFASPDTTKRCSCQHAGEPPLPSGHTLPDPETGSQTSQYHYVAEANGMDQPNVKQGNARSLQRQDDHGPVQISQAAVATGRRAQSPKPNQGPNTSHPTYMTDEEFNAPPCWSDVEDDPICNTGYHLRHVTSNSVRPIVHARAPLSEKFRPTPLNGPPGFSPTPRFIGACAAVWCSSFDEFVSDNQDEQSLLSRASAESVSPNPRLIGTIDGNSFLELVNTKLQSHVGHVQNSTRRSNSMQDNPSVPTSSSADEWSVYHIGSRMLPRNPLLGTTVRTEGGQRGVRVVTLGQPSKPSSEIARTLSSRRARALSTSYLDEIDPELDGSTLTDSVHIRLRGGAGSEDEESSEKKYVPPSSRPSSLHLVRSTYPSPQEWLQLLSLQGDHATTPCDYLRAARIMGLGQVASRGFASTATLQVPNSSNTRGSAGSSSETLINQSSQERAPNYSHLRPSQPRPSSGGEDGEPRRRPIVISEEPSPVVRVSQYQSRASLTARSNFQELLSESDPGPSYPGDGDHLPAPPPLVDDSRDPDMDPAPGIVMNPSMPAHSNIPVGNLPPVQNSIGNLPQVQNSNVPARARTRVHGEPQTMQIDEHVQDPHGALSLCDCCEIPPEVLEWCGIAFESAIEACVIL